ncbi:hypothetical protein HK101_005663 [Irineochytrium annulatum]|nr:hypothetical protein HK101_005663 [Irineochytrium annulatum]
MSSQTRQRLHAHALRLLRSEAVTTQCIVLSLLLIARLRDLNRSDPVRDGAECNLLATALLVAQKVLDDDRVDNAGWAPWAGMPLEVVSGMEREFLAKIRWQTHVTASEYASFIRTLKTLADEMAALQPSHFPKPPVFSQAHHTNTRHSHHSSRAVTEESARRAPYHSPPPEYTQAAAPVVTRPRPVAVPKHTTGRKRERTTSGTVALAPLVLPGADESMGSGLWAEMARAAIASAARVGGRADRMEVDE